MKKLLILIVLIMIPAFMFGCSRSNIKLTLQDEVTGLPVNGSIMINGSDLVAVNGVVSVKSGELEISSNYYQDTQITVSNENKEMTVKLKPKAWLLINCNVQNPDIEVDGVIQDKIYTENGYKLIVSPISIASHKIAIRKQYFKNIEFTLLTEPNENTINATLEPDEDAIASLINSLTFPDKMSSYNFNVQIEGTFNGTTVNHSFSGEVINGNLEKVKENSFEYSFVDGKPYLDGEEVKDEEKSFALIFAKNTIEDFLDFKDSTKGLSLNNVTNGFVTFKGQKKFEERNFEEDLSFQLSDHQVNRVIISINSEELGVNLLFTVDLEMR